MFSDSDLLQSHLGIVGFNPQKNKKKMNKKKHYILCIIAIHNSNSVAYQKKCF